MARIFLSHSSADVAAAVALRDWLMTEGWDDLFLDLDPDRGITAGERWDRALNEAAGRCEAIVFLVSNRWLSSRWCVRELDLARRLNKRLIGVLIEDHVATTELPPDVTGTWQLIDLAGGPDRVSIPVTVPTTGSTSDVTFSHRGLAQLKQVLVRTGIDATNFQWPPPADPDRSPYPGLRAFEAEDAGVYFGRNEAILKATDQLRGICDSAQPRLFAIIGASGVGKSSFLRAGLLPRLQRNEEYFVTLPIIRPGRGALYGDTGLAGALANACNAAGMPTPSADLRSLISQGADPLKGLLRALADRLAIPRLMEDRKRKPPTLVLPVDHSEELFLPEGEAEAHSFLEILRGLLAQTKDGNLIASDDPPVAAVLTLRADYFEQLSRARPLMGIQCAAFELAPLSPAAYSDVIRGPARRLEQAGRPFRFDDALVHQLLRDAETTRAVDALPLLALTLARLYDEHGGQGSVGLDQYRQSGALEGSIERAVARVLATDHIPSLPKEETARLAMLRRTLIPHLVAVDPDTGAPRRRVAAASEFPHDVLPLLDCLVIERLVIADVAKDDGQTFELATEAVLKGWRALRSWIEEDQERLTAIEAVRRAATDWAERGRTADGLAHKGERLAQAHAAGANETFSRLLSDIDKEYLAACQASDRRASTISEIEDQAQIWHAGDRSDELLSHDIAKLQEELAPTRLQDLAGSLTSIANEYINQCRLKSESAEILLESSKRFTYDVFISYSHEDISVSTWLYGQLLTFDPKGEALQILRSRRQSRRPFRRIFRDQRELIAGGSLDAKIERALTNSRKLVVICSRASARSDWVNLEVARFIKLRGIDHVIPFWIDGEIENCAHERWGLPPCLREVEGLPLCVDGRIEDNRPQALVDLLSGLLSMPKRVLFPSISEYSQESIRIASRIHLNTNITLGITSVCALMLMFLVAEKNGITTEKIRMVLQPWLARF